jgi:hypothetical protein
MILIFKHIIPSNYCGLTIYPFIFLSDKKLKSDKKLLNHEKIHLKQQLELVWVFFFIWYTFEYLIRLLQYKNHHKAYKNISFEKEAYQNEYNLDYLSERRKFSFLRYLS